MYSGMSIYLNIYTYRCGSIFKKKEKQKTETSVSDAILDLIKTDHARLHRHQPGLSSFTRQQQSQGHAHRPM